MRFRYKMLWNTPCGAWVSGWIYIGHPWIALGGLVLSVVGFVEGLLDKRDIP
jgi:hypothetical protein